MMLLDSNRSRIFTLKKKCVKITKNASYNSHMEPLSKNLKMLKLNDIIENELCEIAFHFKENIISKLILASFLK